MAKYKKDKKAKKLKKFSIGFFITILGMFGGLYAYQYHMYPEIKIKDIEARYARAIKKDDMRIEFSFKIQNNGRSKTTHTKLFSAFPKWTIKQSGVFVTPDDFVYSDISDLAEGQETTFLTYKDVNTENFIQYTNMANGIYLIVVLRWQSDNLIFLGRTFENHILFFLMPGMKDNKMVFQCRQIEQRHFTHWFMKQSNRPDIFKTVVGLGATRLLYGDVSRFD